MVFTTLPVPRHFNRGNKGTKEVTVQRIPTVAGLIFRVENSPLERREKERLKVTVRERNEEVPITMVVEESQRLRGEVGND